MKDLKTEVPAIMTPIMDEKVIAVKFNEISSLLIQAMKDFKNKKITLNQAKVIASLGNSAIKALGGQIIVSQATTTIPERTEEIDT